MKSFTHFILIAALTLTGCVMTPGSGVATTREQRIADIAEDTLAIGLVPILTNNPGYLEAARGIAVVAATFTGDTLSAEAVYAVLIKFGVTDDDARIVAGIITVAWESYTRRYQNEVGVSVRPDVKVFLKAVAAGISRAVASVPAGRAAAKAALASPK